MVRCLLAGPGDSGPESSTQSRSPDFLELPPSAVFPLCRRKYSQRPDLPPHTMQILWLEGPSAAREKLCAFLASFPGCGGNPAPVSVETRLPRSPLPRGGAGGRCPSPGLQPLSGWERPQSPFNLSVPLLPCLPFLLSFRVLATTQLPLGDMGREGGI